MASEEELLAILTNKEGKLDRLLKIAALYLIGGEALRSTIEGHARNFFGLNGKLGFKAVLPVDFGDLNSKHQAKRVDAAARWFCSLDAFTEDDRKLVRRSLDLRNMAAHELLNMFFTREHVHLDEGHIRAMVGLIHKANVWWLRNIERQVNPLFPNEATDEELERSESGVELLLGVLFRAAFPDHAQVACPKEPP